MAQAAEMQVTPEEARFLRRFFRRQALPWMLALGVAAIAAARWAVPAADPGLERRLGEANAAIEALRAENAVLRTHVEALGQRVGPAVDRRLAAAEGRLDAVERRPAGAPRDASDLAGRLARLEERLASAASAHDTVTRSNLARLQELESRLGAVEGTSAPLPAAPAP
jgi:hypothetical protein